MSIVPDAITTARAKAYLGIPSGTTEHDTFLGYLISSATRHVAERLNLTCGLTENTYSDVMDVENFGQDRVRLPRFPVVSVAALTDDTTAVIAADRYLKADRWVVLKGDSARFTQGKQKVSATYVAGWNTIPGDVLHAISSTVAYHFNAVPKGGISSERIGAYAVALARGDVGPLSSDADAILGSYISPVTPR